LIDYVKERPTSFSLSWTFNTQLRTCLVIFVRPCLHTLL